jgi:hypothetical protein
LIGLRTACAFCIPEEAGFFDADQADCGRIGADRFNQFQTAPSFGSILSLICLQNFLKIFELDLLLSSLEEQSAPVGS